MITAPRTRRVGALTGLDEALTWRVWAPHSEQVDLLLGDGEQRHVIPMQKEKDGFFRHREPSVAEGQRYAYRLQSGPERPDPCSLWQPDGVHAFSAVFRPARLKWTDQAWGGVPRERLVFYEIHVGTFTREGSFEAMIPRLAVLRQLGVTALEIMPISQFPGARNWGYDGVCLYAAHHSYGGPQGLHRLVDACHAAGLAIFLDVVYNHFGPEGNYLREFGPYFTDRYKTPWGSALNYDSPYSEPVRDFVLDNARMWLEEFHFDGLRLDAVHAIFDLGARHLLQALKQVANEVADRTGRTIHIIAESDLNDPRPLLSRERGGYGLDAQWSDDFHHAVHAYLTGERRGYYADFGGTAQLAEVLHQPYLYAGHYSACRQRKHGAPVPQDLRGDQFVVCLQNHDQIGNRARGDRPGTLLGSPAKQRLSTSLMLLSPFVPLLFMGEEYGEENPFPFFCSFEDAELVKAVREGRKREFAEFAWQGEVPDPQSEATFASARLSWSWPQGSPRAQLRQLYCDLLLARRQWPALGDFQRYPARLLDEAGQGPILEFVRGKTESAQEVRVFGNLSDQPQPLPVTPDRHQHWLFRSEALRYGGKESEPVLRMAPYECLALGPQSLQPLSGQP